MIPLGCRGLSTIYQKNQLAALHVKRGARDEISIKHGCAFDIFDCKQGRCTSSLFTSVRTSRSAPAPAVINCFRSGSIRMWLCVQGFGSHIPLRSVLLTSLLTREYDSVENESVEI